MANLEDAILIAVGSHRSQREKNGMPYVLHPLRLMLNMKTEEEMTVAVLHDVLEDSDTTAQDLRARGLSRDVIAAIQCLTRRGNESYGDYVQRIKENPMAVKVKLADLEDNMNVKRLVEIAPADLERMRRYHGVWRELTGLSEE